MRHLEWPRVLVRFMSVAAVKMKTMAVFQELSFRS